MESLINEKVTHIKFGHGIIAAVNEDHLTIQFDSSEAEKIFKYPDAFEKFIVFSKSSLQEKAMQLLDEVKAEKEAQGAAKKLEYERFIEELRKERSVKPKKQRKVTNKK